MAVDHYENFPVASVLVPRALRPAVEALYAFARSADDIADEGDATVDERVAHLSAYAQTILGATGQSDARFSAQASSYVLPAHERRLLERLLVHVSTHQLPVCLLLDLLDAFRQDLHQHRYSSYDDLLGYCRRSADPVGRLMLHLFDATDADHLPRSDAICTALQLINFWQDVAIDWRKGRIYLPAEDRQHFGVEDAVIAEGRHDDPAWRALMAFEITRTRALMMSGASLAHDIPGRFGWELRLVVLGGLRILEKIEAVDYDVFHRRPVLTPSDWGRLAWRALTFR